MIESSLLENIVPKLETVNKTVHEGKKPLSSLVRSVFPSPPLVEMANIEISIFKNPHHSHFYGIPAVFQ